MRAELDCIPCTLKGVLTLIKLSTDNEDLRRRLLREIVKMFGEADWDVLPLRLYQAAQQLVSRVTGINDPYYELKREHNRKALELYPTMKRMIEEDEDPLGMAAKIAAMGNMIDFGIFAEADLEGLVNRLKRLEFAVNDIQSFREGVLKADEVIYFLDNAGEIVFDKVLLEAMIQFRGRPFKTLTLVCREKPTINDAVAQDVEEVSLSRLPNAQIESLTSDLEYVVAGGRVEVIERIEQHDLAIFKGQVNLESFLGRVEGFFLLVAKCPVIAKLLGVREGDLVLKYATPRIL